MLNSQLWPLGAKGDRPMKCETPQKRVANSRLMWQLLVLLTIAAMLLTGCGAAFPAYPGAKSANRDEGMNAVAACGESARILIGRPGGQIKINPQSYSTPDSLDIVKAWYEQNLTDWGEVGAPCGNGVSYVFPKGCTAAAGQCDKQLYVLDNVSGGTWIVVITR
jgi:hypothetical protein